jgi:hypothetical protein
MKRYLPVIAAVVVLLFSGLVHGLWTDRWSDRQDLQAAAAKLRQLPTRLGEWEGEDLAPRGRSSGELAGSLSRRYVHRPTGRVVTLFLACGKHNKVAIHTPDVCYPASGFKEVTKQPYTLPVSSAQPGSVFMTASFRRERADDHTQLRIFWSWASGGGKWEVAEDPRTAFKNRPVLYKLYVLRETGGTPEPLETDPCLDLINRLLPALRRDVLPAS